MSLFIRLAGLALPLVVLLSACDKDSTSEPAKSTSGTAQITVVNTAGGQPLQLGNMSYVNGAGNTYQVDLLKYYLSNLTFIKQDGTEFNCSNYDLIDASDSASCILKLTGIPNGTYTTLRISLGIDSATNYSLDNTGDLDPSYGMFWPWNTGYIFFKHEGYYQDTAGVTQQLFFHYGTDAALSVFEIPCNVTVDGNTKKINLQFDLNSAYDSPFPIDFNIDNYHQSTGTGDRDWIENLRVNFMDAFTVTSVQ